MTTVQSWRVAESDVGLRLDRFVAERMDTARHQVQRWIDDHLVLIDGRGSKAGFRLRLGSEITCSPPPPVEVDPRIEPEAGPLEVLYEDEQVTVIDKPSDLTVHPGAGRPQGTLVHRLLFRDPALAGVGGPGRPGIVHRLDKDTTGVMVIARTQEAYRVLAAAFSTRTVEKQYLAITYGRPREDQGFIAQPIGRDPRDRKRMAIRPRSGRPARTTYELLAQAEQVAVLRLGLETGRTHQIRIHLKALGHPLVGDPTYGEARWRSLPSRIRAPLRKFPRPALHARTLAFAHPVSGEPVRVTAPVPEDLLALWRNVTSSDWPDDGQPSWTHTNCSSAR